MDITFAGKKLAKLVNSDRKMFKELGKMRANILRRRLTQLRDAASLEDTRHLPGRFHELKRDKKGQWACDLDQPYRLIFIPQEISIPISEDGQYNWADINAVEIVAIINYHKEK